MIGDNIRAARKRKKVTLEDLAEKINSSSGTLSHIERGTRNPSLEMLAKIADALGVEQQELLVGDKAAENKYYKELEHITFTDKNTSKILDQQISNNINWGLSVVSERTVPYNASNIEGATPITCKFIKLPVLGKIPAGVPIEAKENIIDYVIVPETEVSNGSYFYLQVVGDSMINSGIRHGYRVLVKRQQDVESGEIAVVRVNSHDATLKRVKKIDGQVILYPDNPAYEPIFIKEEGAEIIGKIIKVEFDPNKKY